MGQSHEHQDIAKFSSFHVRALKACERWSRATSTRTVGNIVTYNVVYGKDALLHKYALVERSSKGKLAAAPCVDDLGELRRFKWLLAPGQQAQLSVWVKAFARQHRLGSSTARLGDATEDQEAKESSSPALPPPLPDKAAASTDPTAVSPAMWRCGRLRPPRRVSRRALISP